MLSIAIGLHVTHSSCKLCYRVVSSRCPGALKKKKKKVARCALFTAGREKISVFWCPHAIIERFVFVVLVHQRY